MDPSRYTILVEFAFRHLDFQMAELESVLDMFGILPEIERHALPNPQHTPHRPFCVFSLPADSPFLAASTESSKSSSNDSDDSPTVPYPKIAECILARCALVRSVVELWGMGATMADCATQTQAWIRDADVGRQQYQRLNHKSVAWKMTVHAMGSKYAREEQEAVRETFRFLELPGPVRLKESADSQELVVLREGELDAHGGPVYPRYDAVGNLDAANDARPPLGCYFGRVLHQRQDKHRAGIHHYSLKKRSYLGPTSMDAELSFIMTNLAQVQAGSMVLDPFCGTGSILVSCACRGGYTVGTDIDIRVLKGRSSKENVYSNFEQFNLPRPELIRSDNANYHRHFMVDRPPVYDAIVTDPPYGIRAGARQSGSKLENPKPVQEDQRHDHIAQTKPYPVSDVMADLVDVAARVLRRGGRLVYIIPSMTDFDAETDLPQHPCLQTRHICYQPLSTELGRRVVCLEKIEDYDSTKRQEYLSAVWKNGPESAEKCANIREKLIAAAKQKPNYAQKAAARRKKRQENKQAKKRAKLQSKAETAAA